MSVSIQDVLTLLPELFPGVQPISLDRIRPYPDNPGPPVTEDQVQELTVPILEDGLVNPLKLRPDPAGPLAPGLSPHPNNPRLKMDGNPWVVEDFNWMILSGERRWRAFRKLHEEGWVWRGGASVGHKASYRLARGPQAEGQVLAVPGQGAQPQTGPDHLAQLEGAGEAFIPAHILNPTGEEAVIITHTDNDVRDRGWFADHQSIEALIKANPSLTQGRVAAGLKMDRSRVNEALQLLPLLNPEARALICGNSTIQNKGKKGISESAVLWLAELGPGSGLKRGVKAAGAEAQKLWPYPAIPPETQDLVRRALVAAIDHRMTEDKVKTLVQWVKEGNKPEYYSAKGLAPVQPTEGRPAQPKTATEKASPYAKASGDKSGERLTGGAGSSVETAHPKQGPRLMASIRGWWPEVKSFLLSQFKRTLGNLLRRWMATGLVALVVILLLSPHLYVSLYRLAMRCLGSCTVITPSTQAVPGLSTPNYQLLTPNLGKTIPSANPAQVTSHHPRKRANPPVGPPWSPEGSAFASEFAGRFYGVTPQNWSDTKDYFLEHTDDDHIDYVPKYFGPAWYRQMQRQNLSCSFQVTDSTFSRMKGGSGIFLVSGKQTRKTDGVAPTTRTVALSIQIQYHPDGKSMVEEVTDLSPDKVEADAPKGEGIDPLKAAEDGVKDYQSAVSTAGDAKAATDKAKGILGL